MACKPRETTCCAFYNTAQTFTAECPDGLSGDSVTVTIPKNTVSGATQDEANATALAMAQSQAETELCCCTDCPECEDCDVFSGPLNNAVYESGRDAIFAVNGGRVFKLNATTGKRISDARFTTPDWGPSFITYAANVDKLCISSWNDPVANSETPISGIFTINPDTFAVDNFASYTVTLDSTFGSGPQGLEYSSNFVFGMYRHRAGFSIYIIKFNPATNSPTSSVNIDGASTYLLSQCAIKSSDGSVSAVTRQRVRNYSSALVFNFFTGFLINGRIGRGLAHDLTNANYYVVTGTQYVQKAAASSGAAFSEIDTGRANATPQRAKWNSIDGKIYIPAWKDNTIIIIDPANADSVTIKTGFDSPYDVVFTPTKAFAVQHGRQGLKEIT